MFDEGEESFRENRGGFGFNLFRYCLAGECFYSCLWPINLICNSSASVVTTVLVVLWQQGNAIDDAAVCSAVGRGLWCCLSNDLYKIAIKWGVYFV